MPREGEAWGETCKGVAAAEALANSYSREEAPALPMVCAVGLSPEADCEAEAAPLAEAVATWEAGCATVAVVVEERVALALPDAPGGGGGGQGGGGSGGRGGGARCVRRCPSRSPRRWRRPLKNAALRCVLECEGLAKGRGVGGQVEEGVWGDAGGGAGRAAARARAAG